MAGFPLLGLDDDVLAVVLSFLRPPDLARCACASSKLRALCRDDEKVWLPACQRRWGHLTSVPQWVPHTCPPPGPFALSSSPVCPAPAPLQPRSRPGSRGRFEALYHNLDTWESLVGCWRGVGETHMGSLVLFEWKERFIEGVRVLPAGESTFGVLRVPFARLAFDATSRSMCHVDADWPAQAETLLRQISSRTGNPSRRGSQANSSISNSSSHADFSDVVRRLSMTSADPPQPIQEEGIAGTSLSRSSGPPTVLQHQRFPLGGLRAALLLSPHQGSIPSSMDYREDATSAQPLVHRSTEAATASSPVLMEAEIELCGQNHVTLRTIGSLQSSLLWRSTWNLRQGVSLPAGTGRAAFPPGPCIEGLRGPGEDSSPSCSEPVARLAGQPRGSLESLPFPVHHRATAAVRADLLSSSPPHGFPLGSRAATASLLARHRPGNTLEYGSYETVASRSEPSGGQKSARKLRRKERALAELLASSSGVRGQASASVAAAMTGEAEHIVRISTLEPQMDQGRPLEGLWKGICQHKSLDFVLVTYDLPGSIRCRRVAQFRAQRLASSQEHPQISRSEYSRPGKVGTVRWTANIQSLIKAPLPAVEMESYLGRRKFREIVHTAALAPELEHLAMLSARGTPSSRGLDYSSDAGTDGDSILGCYKSLPDPESVECTGGLKPGRVWLYSNGTFGYSPGHTDFTIDYKPVWQQGHLCDDVSLNVE